MYSSRPKVRRSTFSAMLTARLYYDLRPVSGASACPPRGSASKIVTCPSVQTLSYSDLDITLVRRPRIAFTVYGL